MNFVNFLVSLVAGATIIGSTVVSLPKESPKVEVKVANPVTVVATSTKPIEKKAKIIKYIEEIETKGDCEEYRDIISNYQWPVETAMAICAAESQGYASTSNMRDVHHKADGSVLCIGSYGLMQVACMHPSDYGYTVEDLHDPNINIEISYKIWEKQGFCPWTTYSSPECD